MQSDRIDLFCNLELVHHLVAHECDGVDDGDTDGLRHVLETVGAAGGIDDD